MSKRRVFILSIIIIICIITLIYFVFLKRNVYEVTFDCGIDCNIKKQYVEKNKKVKIPEIPEQNDKIFVEWQLNGKKYNFNNKVTENINLKAKWLPEKYITVTIDYDNELGKTVTDVLSGTSIENLVEIPKKQGYTFVGWYLDDKEYDLNKKVTSELSIKAKWLKEDFSLKIGDNVLIIGDYSESSTSLNAYHSKAIGWKRKIVYIYNGREFPYAVGNEYGITGYFKIDSLERID